MSSELFRNIDHLIDQVGGRAKEEVEKAILQEVFDKSQIKVPVVTGNLRDSGDIRDRSVVYTADYAVDVHERPEGRGYKFLQRAIEQTDAMRIAEEVLFDEIDFF